MPRNGAGVFNLAQPAFQSQTPISSGAMNSDLSDIADGLTGSLPRDGQAAMTAVLPLASTGFNYAADPNTGMRRTAADAQAIQCGGVDVLEATATGVEFPLGATIDGVPIVPSGTVVSYAGSTAPGGWLLCFGQAVSRTTYAALFAVLGTVFGSGDGSTTFNLPDLRGRVTPGKDDMGGVSAGRLSAAMASTTLGGVGGAPNVILTQGNLPATSYNLAGTGATISVTSTRSDIVVAPNGVSNPRVGGPLDNTVPSTAGAFFTVGLTSTGSYTPAGTIGPLGSGGAFNTIPPSLILNTIIKT